ncbi:MAG TPA: hypothetical protein VF773_09795 [Verrucomicrobiae bacterium]
MNAGTRLSLRTKLILGLFAVGLACVVGVTAFGAARGEPKIEVTLSHFETNENAVFAVMSVKNSGTAPAIFRGYGKTNAVLEQTYRDPSGAWEPRIGMMCGTGLSYHMIWPGEVFAGREYISRQAKWRIGFQFRDVEWFDRIPKALQREINYTPRANWNTQWSREFTAGPVSARVPEESDGTFLAFE